MSATRSANSTAAGQSEVAVMASLAPVIRSVMRHDSITAAWWSICQAVAAACWA